MGEMCSMQSIRRFLLDDDGTTAVEYAVMLALIIATVITAIAALGSGADGMWGGIDSDLDGVGFG
jgi:pilus assembly protein Flp/PilA